MASTKSLYNFSFGNATHVGLVRHANEDYFGSFETKNGYVFLVCDGMGGHVGGAKASQIAVESIRDMLQQTEFSSPADALSQSITSANDAILEYADNNPELQGMGTTCVALLVVGSEVYYAHVGDSRIYLFSDCNLIRLTKDHSFVQNMIDAGGLTQEQAEKHPRRNEITNALGLKNMKPPTVCKTPVKAAKGDIFLLCSDGLTGMVRESEIESVIKDSTDLVVKANRLVELANQAGGKDNVTVQLIEIKYSPYKKTAFDSGNTQKRKRNSKKKLLLLAVFSILIVSGGTLFLLKKNLFPTYFKNKIQTVDSLKNRTKPIKSLEHSIDTSLQKEIVNDLNKKQSIRQTDNAKSIDKGKPEPKKDKVK